MDFRTIIWLSSATFEISDRSRVGYSPKLVRLPHIRDP
jgi:hypothetical protein